MPKHRFDKRLSNISPSIWSKIAKIDELKGRWIGGLDLSPQVLGRLKKSVLITSTGASTRIEGAKLSDREIERCLKALAMEKFSDRDKQEVKGYYELLQNVFDSWSTVKFSESAIKHFHKELLKYVEKDKLHRGEYKKTENKVQMIDERGKAIGVLFETTPAYLTPKEMLELVEWTKEVLERKALHPLFIVGNFIVEFLNIHPFQDGNGRLSRILTNLLLLKEEYLYMPYVSHEKLIEENKPNYYIALRKSQKTFKSKKEDISKWLDFFLDIVLQQSKLAIDLLSKENIETILSEKQLLVWQFIQTVEECTPIEISKKLKIRRPTINQIMNKLLDLKKVERIGMGRAVRYRATKI
ncbi:MAG: Fic family protein [Candidatus Melainabacteria bacterium]|nr:Fic family protein [Candidatus Melainabacteria bacterium]